MLPHFSSQSKFHCKFHCGTYFEKLLKQELSYKISDLPEKHLHFIEKCGKLVKLYGLTYENHATPEAIPSGGRKNGQVL